MPIVLEEGTEVLITKTRALDANEKAFMDYLTFVGWDFADALSVVKKEGVTKKRKAEVTRIIRSRQKIETVARARYLSTRLIGLDKIVIAPVKFNPMKGAKTIIL